MKWLLWLLFLTIWSGGKILPSFWKNLPVILVKICRHFDENMPTIWKKYIDDLKKICRRFQKRI